MKRKSKKIPVNSFFNENEEFSGRNIELYTDEKTYDEIMDFLLETDANNNLIRIERFRKILVEIFSFRYNKDLYDKPKISNKSKDVTIMKFKKHRGSNWRILCKEFISKGKKIVMIALIDKKSQGINKKQKQKMEAIGAYEYDF